MASEFSNDWRGFASLFLRFAKIVEIFEMSLSSDNCSFETFAEVVKQVVS